MAKPSSKMGWPNLVRIRSCSEEEAVRLEAQNVRAKAYGFEAKFHEIEKGAERPFRLYRNHFYRGNKSVKYFPSVDELKKYLDRIDDEHNRVDVLNVNFKMFGIVASCKTRWSESKFFFDVTYPNDEADTNSWRSGLHKTFAHITLIEDFCHSLVKKSQGSLSSE